MRIPKILFKYQAFTPDALSNLTNRQIWFSRPAKFNDPFDCAIHIGRNPIPDPDYQRMFELCRAGSGNPTAFDAQYSPSNFKNPLFRKSVQAGLDAAFEKRISVMQNDRGVCCFSACNSNILMWSHYAACHKGFCLGFKTEAAPFSEAFCVEYEANIPAVNPASLLLDEIEDSFVAMMVTKSLAWRYEEEWRLFHMEPDKAYGYDAGALESVYFGAMMPEDQQIVIGRLLDGTGTKFYRMARDPSMFAVYPKPITFKVLP